MRQEDDLHDAVLKDVAGFAVTTTTAGAIMGSGKVKVHCPIGKIALGGGFYTKLPPHHLNHTTLESGPSKSHSWICESKGYQQEAGSELSCYVQCGVTKWAKGSKHASSLHVTSWHTAPPPRWKPAAASSASANIRSASAWAGEHAPMPCTH